MVHPNACFSPHNQERKKVVQLMFSCFLLPAFPTNYIINIYLIMRGKGSVDFSEEAAKCFHRQSLFSSMFMSLQKDSSKLVFRLWRKFVHQKARHYTLRLSSSEFNESSSVAANFLALLQQILIHLATLHYVDIVLYKTWMRFRKGAGSTGYSYTVWRFSRKFDVCSS